MAAGSSFRSFLPSNGTHPRLGEVNLGDHDTYTWTEFGLKAPMIQDLWAGWQKLYHEPFIGITTNGQIKPDLFTLRVEDAPTQAMCTAAKELIQQAKIHGVVEKLCFHLDANEWRCWMNPEFYLARHGLRLEEQPASIQRAWLQLLEASLSTRGYRDFLTCMRLNGFFGELVGAPRLMNEKSYNFIIFGEPSIVEPWGWSFWGHHLSACVLVIGGQMVVSPVFRGCEPNEIDTGPYSGTRMFDEEMRLATTMMKTLSEDERKKVIVYDALDHPDMPEGFPHPADGRTLTGAYEDNRIIPYSGGCVGLFSSDAQQSILALIEGFLSFLPRGPLRCKMDDVRKHLDDTWLTWMGQYGESDVFHFRIHGPVLICEFDHECGMYLTNDQPKRFHVHTIVRTPNGNDYGKELIKLWKARREAQERLCP